jgi:hypothetical protein
MILVDPTPMTQLLLQYSPTATEAACGLCGEPTTLSAGTQLVLAENTQPVCQTCGRRHAPPLAALLQLADEAERVGRIGRHTVFPPYTALLDLARAADNYASTRNPPKPA